MDPMPPGGFEFAGVPVRSRWKGARSARAHGGDDVLGTIVAAVLILYPTPEDTGFADYLYGAGEFSSAASEYMRVLYESGGDTLAFPEASLRLARCWQELDRPLDALTLYERLSRDLDGDPGAMALMGIGSVLEEMGELEGARGAYLDAALRAETPALQERSGILAALMLAREDRWEESATELESVPALGGPMAVPAARLAGLVSSGVDLPARSPFWCGLASAVLPGSGQALCGNLTDGLIALGVNGVMGLLVVESIRGEDLAASVLVGWLGLSFYGGNIYGGARAADGYNAARRRQLLEEITAILEEAPPAPVP
jgi:tetratricopeptide (TPR) repeat protein